MPTPPPRTVTETLKEHIQKYISNNRYWCYFIEKKMKFECFVYHNHFKCKTTIHFKIYLSYIILSNRNCHIIGTK